MEQTALKGGHRNGWSSAESDMLWETAEEAHRQGMPLKQVFERVASQTGRRPNSIRNYYYAQVRERGDGPARTVRFVPFEESEVDALLERVLRARAQGQSVRACLKQMADGDHSLMLRYQNKYRSVLKSRPDMVRRAVERLNGEGVRCEIPDAASRGARDERAEACGRMCEAARASGDEELARACRTFERLIRAGVEPRRVAGDRMGVRLDLYRLALEERCENLRALCEASEGVIDCAKGFLAEDARGREEAVHAFSGALAERLGALETRVTECTAVLEAQRTAE